MYWLKAMLWYIKDANSPGFSPKEWKSGSESRGEDLKQREDAVTKQEQETAAKEAELNKFADQMAAKEKTLNELEESAANSGQNSSASKVQADVQRQLDDLRIRERDFAANEAAAAEREKQALRRERELKKIAANLKVENVLLLEQMKKAEAQKKAAESKPCNHKLYPPPKKIERRVVGFLYE
jgi:hypothetical protein